MLPGESKLMHLFDAASVRLLESCGNANVEGQYFGQCFADDNSGLVPLLQVSESRRHCDIGYQLRVTCVGRAKALGAVRSDEPFETVHIGPWTDDASEDATTKLANAHDDTAVEWLHDSCVAPLEPN